MESLSSDFFRSSLFSNRSVNHGTEKNRMYDSYFPSPPNDRKLQPRLEDLLQDGGMAELTTSFPPPNDSDSKALWMRLFVIATRFFLWLQRIWRLSAPICDPSTAKKTLSSGSPVRSSGRPPHGRTYRGKPEGSTRSSSGPRPRKRCAR